MEEAQDLKQYVSKLDRLLKDFLLPEYHTRNDVYLNTLLSHLGDTNKELARRLLELPLLNDWIFEAVLHWENTSTVPHVSIAAFVVNLIALLSRNEDQFVSFNKTFIFDRVLLLFKIRELGESHISLKLAYVRLFKSFLRHEKGVQLVICTKYWEDMVELALKAPTVYINRESREALSLLLEETAKIDDQICLMIVNRLYQNLAISESNFNELELIRQGSNLEINEITLYEKLSPTLSIITTVLELYLECDSFVNNDFSFIKIIINKSNLDQLIINLLLLAKSKNFTYDLERINLLLAMYDFVLKLSDVFDKSKIAETMLRILSILHRCLELRHSDNIIKICYNTLIYWKLVRRKIPGLESWNVDKKEKILFKNQVLSIQMLPIFMSAVQLSTPTYLQKRVQEDDLRENFVCKIFKIMCEHTIRFNFKWRDFLYTRSDNAEIATGALSYIMNSRKAYEKDHAVIVFQCFTFAIKDIIDAMRKPENFGCYSQMARFLSQVLDATAVFINEYGLTWKDTLETMCLIGFGMSILDNPVFTSQVVVKALKLMNISIAKYMAPNLALLVDKTSDSNMALVSPLLYLKCHDPNWEVRDSSLEILCTISNLAHTKFPSFQKVLLETELPSLVVKMSVNDGESFVRATALKCLCDMIRIPDFWKNLNNDQDITQMIMQIIQNETEGIVRKEATTVMCCIYENHQLNNETLQTTFNLMSFYAIADLHWEVKIEALKFWELVIRNSLQDQGMIDGSFPSVTFSKENRKIVTLNETEIRRRLQKVLLKLSSIGCLGVLVNAIQDECDLEVSKKAVDIAQTFLKLLNKYNVTPETACGSCPASPAVTESSLSPLSSSGVSSCSGSASRDVPDFSDEVVGQIVNSRDFSLLRDVYNPSDLVSLSSSGVSAGSKRVISPGDFVSFGQQDFGVLIEERKRWLKGIDELESLLDDMLKNYDDEFNSMDCY